jgi:hypothetical protein
VPATAERLPAKYLVKEEAPKIISSSGQHQAYISRLVELQRKAHRSVEEAETAKLRSPTTKRSISWSKKLRPPSIMVCGNAVVPVCSPEKH